MRVLTELPDIKAYSQRVPSLSDNVILSAKSQVSYYYPEHNTPFLFIANLEGTGNYVLNQSRISVSNRSFYLLNENDQLTIDFRNPENRHTLFMLYKPEFIRDCFNTFSRSDEKLIDDVEPVGELVAIPSVPFTCDTHVQGRLVSLSRGEDCSLVKDDKLVLLLKDFFSLIDVARNQIRRVPALKKKTKEEIYRRVTSARDLMNDLWLEKPNLDFIAKSVGMNKFHLLTNFKAIVGETPHQYLMTLRLSKAYELLKTKQYSVTEVCDNLNFESIGSFSNQFKKRYRMSPSQILNF